MGVSWLDAVDGFPVIGVMFEPDFRTASRHLELAAPVLQECRERGLDINVTRLRPYDFRIALNDGHIFDIFVQRLSGRIDPTIDERSGEALEVSPHEAPRFASRLQSLKGYIRTWYEALVVDHPLQVKRIGIVYAAELVGDAQPPGIVNMLARNLDIVSATPDVSQRVETTIVRTIPSPNGWSEECHYRLESDRASRENAAFGEAIRVAFDWQRNIEAEPVNAEKFDELLDECIARALDHFEGLGDGSAWDDRNRQ